MRIISLIGILTIVTAVYLPTEFQFNRIITKFISNSMNTTNKPKLNDLLTLQRGSLFYDYIRQVEDIVGVCF